MEVKAHACNMLTLGSGDKLTIKANGTAHEDIEAGATVFLQVKYGLITLLKKEADLCDNLPKVCLISHIRGCC